MLVSNRSQLRILRIRKNVRIQCVIYKSGPITSINIRIVRNHFFKILYGKGSSDAKCYLYHAGLGGHVIPGGSGSDRWFVIRGGRGSSCCYCCLVIIGGSGSYFRDRCDVTILAKGSRCWYFWFVISGGSGSYFRGPWDVIICRFSDRWSIIRGGSGSDLIGRVENSSCRFDQNNRHQRDSISNHLKLDIII